MQANNRLNVEQTKAFVEKEFMSNALPTIEDYIRIPNLSRFYDPQWNSNGLLEKAAHHILNWINAQNIKGLKSQFIQAQGRTPTLLLEIDATESDNTETLLMYGHFDKQPHMEGWLEGLSPIVPVIRGEKLYGRGGADDGYAGFAAVLAIKACQEQNLPHARIVVLLEGDEESGSGDLPFYLEQHKEQIGTPNIIICLDSGALNYEQLWVTTSLRGVVIATLDVKVLTEGVHSGDASGVVPSSFRVIRQLLDRIDNSYTGEMPSVFNVNIPSDRYAQLQEVVKATGNTIIEKFPFEQGVQPTHHDAFQNMLNRTWKPTISYVGVDGIPNNSNAGNVLRTHTTLKISMRCPPTLDVQKAGDDLKRILESNPPYGAKVNCTIMQSGPGWNAPSTEPYLEKILNNASVNFFGKEPKYQGEGGSIPFMKMLGDKYPHSQFAILGILGPNSNAHGPNEFLHIPMCKGLICCVAQIVADSYKNCV